MITKDIVYSGGGKTLTGYLADGSNGKKAPGILICHQGGGLRDHEKDRSGMLANSSSEGPPRRLIGHSVIATKDPSGRYRYLLRYQ